MGFISVHASLSVTGDSIYSLTSTCMLPYGRKEAFCSAWSLCNLLLLKSAPDSIIQEYGYLNPSEKPVHYFITSFLPLQRRLCTGSWALDLHGHVALRVVCHGL